MEEGTSHLLLAAGLVLAMIVIPVGIASLFPAEPHQPVGSAAISRAINASGVTIVSETPGIWSFPGLMAGKVLLLQDRGGNTVLVRVLQFDDAASRDAVIRAYHSVPVGRGRPAGGLIVTGDTLVYYTPHPSPVIREIGASLRELAIAGRQG